MPIQRKIPPTHTYSAHIDTCVHVHIGVHMHTHSYTALLREVNSSLTPSCIMWAECSTEVAKWIVTVTVLKWGDITRESSDLEVKAICDTTDDCLCSIGDLFWWNHGGECGAWGLVRGMFWVNHLLYSESMRCANFNGCRDLYRTAFTDTDMKTHTHTRTHSCTHGHLLGNELGSVTVHLK